MATGLIHGVNSILHMHNVRQNSSLGALSWRRYAPWWVTSILVVILGGGVSILGQCIDYFDDAYWLSITAVTWTFSSSLRLQFHYTYAVQKHIRLAYPSLDRNILLTLIYNIFDITFLLVCHITQLYKPAFCHAFIKRILIDWLIDW